MKKITALLLALLMAFSAFALSACKDDPAESSADASAESSVPEAPKTTQELLANAFANTYPAMPGFDTDSDTFNFKGGITLDKEAGNKIEFDLYEALKNNEATLKGDITFIADDEQLAAEAIGSGNDFYVLIDEFSDKAIKVSADSLGEEADSASTEAIEKLLAHLQKIGVLAPIFEEILEGEAVNGLFTNETGDITIGETEYKNENLILFAIDLEDIKAIGQQLSDKAEANGEAKAYLEELADLIDALVNNGDSDDGDKEEAPDIALELKLNSVIREEKVAAFDFLASVRVYDDYNDIKLDLAFAQNGTEKGEGDITVNFTQGTDEEGTAAQKISISVPFAVERLENGFSFKITEIVMEAGMKVTVPCEIRFGISSTESALTVDFAVNIDAEAFSLKLDIEGNVVATKVEAFEITLPAESVSTEEIDAEKFAEFMKNNPKLAEFFSSMSGGNMGDAEEDYLSVYDDYAQYSLYSNGIGEYFTEFENYSFKNNTLKFTFLNGKKITVKFSKVWDDAASGYTLATFGKYTYAIEEYTNTEGIKMVAFILMDGADDKFMGEGSAISIIWYPEFEYGTLLVNFIYEADGDNYTLEYFEGTKTKKYLEQVEIEGDVYPFFQAVK